MLGEFNRVFNVDGTLEEDSQAMVNDGQSQLSRRNSKQYSDAAADKLLGLSGRMLPGQYLCRFENDLIAWSIFS